MLPEIMEKSVKNAWSGSGEVGLSFCEDRVSFGLEFGYFTGKGKMVFGSEENTLDNMNAKYNYAGVLYLS